MIGLLFIFAALIVFAALSVVVGVDSRDDSGDVRRSVYPVGLD
jgi:hypothetical protein